MAEELPRTALEAQIEQEKKELEAAPKIPIREYMGTTLRCHLCGQVKPIGTLKPFDAHIPGGTPRYACESCHPDRGNNAA